MNKSMRTHSSILKGTDADPFTAGKAHFSENNEEVEAIRQSSRYDDKDRAAIDNNEFFETRSNPLSSKGN